MLLFLHVSMCTHVSFTCACMYFVCECVCVCVFIQICELHCTEKELKNENLSSHGAMFRHREPLVAFLVTDVRHVHACSSMNH
jgi:hypothetical protein